MIARRHVEDGIRRVFLQGDTLDVTTVGVLAAATDGCFAAGEDLVVDLSRVKRIDSAGLGAMVGLHRAARRRGQRALFAAITAEVLPAIRRIQLDRILDWSADAATAVAHLRRQREVVRRR